MKWKQSLVLLFSLFFLSSSPAYGYRLTGMQNDLGHGLAGFAGTVVAYGFFKALFSQGRPMNLEQKIMTQVFASVLTSMVLTAKELSDQERGARFDAGAIGYGMIGVGAANFSIIAFDF